MVRTFIFNIISRHHLTAITSVRLTPFMIYSLNELKNQTEKSSLNQRSFETTSRLFPLFTFFFFEKLHHSSVLFYEHKALARNGNPFC